LQIFALRLVEYVMVLLNSLATMGSSEFSTLFSGNSVEFHKSNFQVFFNLLTLDLLDVFIPWSVRLIIIQNMVFVASLHG
jgi:hypothetical protein